jgi:hypothetical protein
LIPARRAITRYPNYNKDVAIARSPALGSLKTPGLNLGPESRISPSPARRIAAAFALFERAAQQEGISIE